jgi:protein-L-isoaspartate(D-aspartate) O-methyltransferase
MNHEDLLIHLTNSGTLVNPNLIRAFQKVDRGDFVLPEYQDYAYEDTPLPTGYGQSLSQPFTVAFMLELLAPNKNQVVLDVGTGSGWTSALLAEVVGAKGRVYTVEIIPQLIEFSQSNLQKYRYSNITQKAASERLGLPEFSPFEKILVSAEAQELPQTLVDQLATGGTLVLPIKGSIVKVDKLPNSILEVNAFPGFAFVPLKY